MTTFVTVTNRTDGKVAHINIDHVSVIVPNYKPSADIADDGKEENGCTIHMNRNEKGHFTIPVVETFNQIMAQVPNFEKGK